MSPDRDFSDQGFIKGRAKYFILRIEIEPIHLVKAGINPTVRALARAPQSGVFTFLY